VPVNAEQRVAALLVRRVGQIVLAAAIAFGAAAATLGVLRAAGLVAVVAGATMAVAAARARR
jgi:hypothetical protein